MNKELFKKQITDNAAITEKALDIKLGLISNDAHFSKIRGLEEAMRYSLMAGGKRLRPCLVMEFAKLFGSTAQNAIDYACSLEMIHTSSLIHDDMPCMDNDELRRGKPTNHIVFGEAFALLAGDALISFAFETLTNNNLSDKQNLLAMQALSYYAGPCGMFGGQQIDLENEGKQIDTETLEVLHAKKTGALIKCACVLGCIAAGKYSGTEEYNDALEYAKDIGLAFQITDDVLDVIGDESKLGKKCGSDEKENKVTYATLLGIEKATTLAKELCTKAKTIIQKYPGSDFLCELADFIAYRDN